MAEKCDVSGCENRAAYIVEPGVWLCSDHNRQTYRPHHDPEGQRR